MISSLTILGSTGSIGVQALDVARLHNIKITALTTNVRIDVLEKQAREFNVKTVAVADEDRAKELQIRLADTDIKVLYGREGVNECAALPTGCVLNSIVGIAGLEPTMSCLESGNNLALANKESLVTGGKLVMDKAKEKNIKILPVDSEHSAIFQSLQGCRGREQVKKLILTASGGPFFGKTKAELESVTLENALNHPNWSMGAKITVDSATMMNKGLEIIEARWLFDVEPENIDVVIHRQSVLHSAVQFIDNSVIGQLGVPDMRIPIQYALTYPDRFISPVRELDLCDYMNLTFEKPDYSTFECLSHSKKALSLGGLYTVYANAANEKANELFRKGQIRFLDIPYAVGEAVARGENAENFTLSDIFEADISVKRQTEELLIK